MSYTFDPSELASVINKLSDHIFDDDDINKMSSRYARAKLGRDALPDYESDTNYHSAQEEFYDHLFLKLATNRLHRNLLNWTDGVGRKTENN